MPKQFVIGDIHGCFRTLSSLIEDDLQPSIEDEIYFLGDYTGKGPHSKEVIKYILRLQDEGYKTKCLLGNHEKMLLDSLLSDKNHYIWLWNGGSETLRSFKVDRVSELKPKYLDFFNSLEYFYELDNFILVHGGLNFNNPDPLKDRRAMLWSRNSYIDKSKINGKRLIVGHTPMKLKKINCSLNEDIIRLDGGCVYSKVKLKQGYLVALELSSMNLYSKYNIDM